MTDHRDLIEILRSTGQLVTGAADAILQATQPGATITDTARCSLESHPRVQTDHSRWETDSCRQGHRPGTPAVGAPMLVPSVARWP